MDEFVDLDALLKIDESCAGQSTVVFTQLGSNAMDCANAGLRVFSTVSAARGLRISSGKSEVLDQEFDPENPVSFHLGLAYFLRMQTRMFTALPTVFSALDSDMKFKTFILPKSLRASRLSPRAVSNYSSRSASIGSRRDARSAGT